MSHTAPAVALCLLCATAAAQEAFVPNERPRLVVPRLSGPIEVDGDLTDAAWQGAARAGGFCEISPRDRARPAVATEVLVGYDDRQLYVAFVADDDPASVRRTLRQRDDLEGDDWVGVVIDTWGDAASAVQLLANPLGVQADARIVTDGEDDSYDTVYYSRGRLTDRGYQVEMAIPFRSLRFPGGAGREWRVTFLRNRPRESEERHSWAAIARGEPCYLCALGRLAGIEGVRPGGTVDLIPAALASGAALLKEPGRPGSGFEGEDLKTDAGVSLRYAPTSSVTVEATVNPDFSQVESDPALIDVNTTFALSLSERRPFFQEGRELYSSWLQTVYTRSFNDPAWASKVTGRAGRWAMSALAVRDDDTRVIIPLEERSEVVRTGASTATVVRARRTLPADSHVGVTLTDRRLTDGGYGSLGAFDGALRIGRAYRVEGEIAGSDTREPDGGFAPSRADETFGRGQGTVAFDGERFSGYGAYLSGERHGRLWSFDFDYRASSPGFRAADGFVARNDSREVWMFQGLSFYPEDGMLDRVDVTANAGRRWNGGGVLKEESLTPQIEMLFKGQTEVRLEWETGFERFRDVDFQGMRQWRMSAETAFSEPLRLEGSLEIGRSIRRTQVPVLGRGLEASLGATVKLLRRVLLEPEWSYSRLEREDTGERLFAGSVLRARLRVQLLRDLLIRLVVEHDGFDDRISVEPLVSYQPNPYTIIYAGAGHTSEPDDLGRRGTASRQWFVKLQWLFRP